MVIGFHVKEVLGNKLDWSIKLKYAFLACTSAPNCDSGLSSLDRYVKASCKMCVIVMKRKPNVCDWVTELQDRLVRLCAQVKMVEAKNNPLQLCVWFNNSSSNKESISAFTCIDITTINAVTSSGPFCIPLIATAQ